MSPEPPYGQQLILAAREMARSVDALSFSPPTTHWYNPLDYAAQPHERYLAQWGSSRKRVLFLGMNPGPWGMAQTGVPFGEVTFVRDWMGIEGTVRAPSRQHPKRPITGFACTRSEVSGRRLWGLMRARFGSPDAFFSDHFVANYCPLVFMEESGRNRTPDHLTKKEAEPLFAACDRHLRRVIEILAPEWVIGVGKYAEGRLAAVVGAMVDPPRVGAILHPSPANPQANRAWEELATRALTALGVWREGPESASAASPPRQY